MTDKTNPSTITEKMPPDHAGVLLSAAAMFITGWGGLYLLVTTQFPRIGGQLWLFFVLLHIAVTGTAIPFVRWITLRLLPSHAPQPPGGIIVRQSVWIGLFVVACAWLRIPRVLSPGIALLLALVFIVVEVFLRARENADE
jgi:hypothetical protein